jgi:hypothetical protein
MTVCRLSPQAKVTYDTYMEKNLTDSTLSPAAQAVDFRALCAELLDELQYWTDWTAAAELKERASAALAEEIRLR